MGRAFPRIETAHALRSPPKMRGRRLAEMLATFWGHGTGREKVCPYAASEDSRGGPVYPRPCFSVFSGTSRAVLRPIRLQICLQVIQNKAPYFPWFTPRNRGKSDCRTRSRRPQFVV
jgi:hypothetical protein